MFATTRIESPDVTSGFTCGVRALDDYFFRHALSNDQRSIGATYVLRRGPREPAEWPSVLGFYTLSMASVTAEHFYVKYGFTAVDDAAWPHRLFLPIATARAAFGAGS